MKKCNAIWHISMLSHMSDQCRSYHHKQTAEWSKSFSRVQAETSECVCCSQIPLNICNAAIQNLCSF